MPIALLLIGSIIVVAALRGTEKELGTLVLGDLSSGFLIWIAAIGGVGALGYIPKIQLPSRMLLALILLAIFLSNGGFWAQFTQAIQHPQPVNPVVPPGPTTPLSVELTAAQGANPLTVQLQGTSSGAGGLGGIVSSAVGSSGGGGLGGIAALSAVGG